MSLLVHWLLRTLAVMVTAYLLPGVTVSGFFAAFVTAVILGIVNTIIRPLLILLTLPVNILTLGLFTFVINAFLVLLVAAVVPGFKVRGFFSAVLFSLILAIINAFLNFVF